jgi:hypothetical protein
MRMDFPTTNGLIGAAAGLALGAADYVLVARILERMPQRTDRGLDAPGLTPDRRQLVMKVVTFIAFVALPVMGYVFGEMVLA